MKLLLEDYKKMKQLDRIEYLLLKKEKKFSFLIVEFVYSILPVILAMMILLFLAYEHTHNTLYILGFGGLITLLRVCFWVFLIVDVILYVIHMNRKKEINEHLNKLSKGRLRR